MRKIPPTPGTNQIAGYVQFRLLTNTKKDKFLVFLPGYKTGKANFGWFDYFCLIFACLRSLTSRSNSIFNSKTNSTSNSKSNSIFNSKSNSNSNSNPNSRDYFSQFATQTCHTDGKLLSCTQTPKLCQKLHLILLIKIRH